MTMVQKKPPQNWPQFPHNPYKMLIIGSPASEKTKSLLNLITQDDYDNFTDKIYLCVKDPNQNNIYILLKNVKK